MQGIDKRDHYRIAEDIDVTLQVIRRSDTEDSDPSDHFDLSPAFLALSELFALEMEAQDQLRALTAENKELGSFLANLNRRLSVLGRAVIGIELGDASTPSPARISEGGISFVIPKLMPVGTCVAIKLLVKPTLLGITAFGEVRHCRLMDDGDAYVAGVRFINLDPVSQKLIARHIIRRQSEERRARLRNDRYSQS